MRDISRLLTGYLLRARGRQCDVMRGKGEGGVKQCQNDVIFCKNSLNKPP